MYHLDKRLFLFILSLMIVSIIKIAPSAQAREVNITPNLPYLDIKISGKSIRIERNQNTKNRLTNGFAKTSRACPPFCVHPMTAGQGVQTVGEIELIRFMKSSVEKRRGLLIDARIPSFYKKGTIPGAVNIPFNLFSQTNNPYFERILAVMGAIKTANGGWDFSKSMALMLFCNGPWCDQSPRAIKNLLAAGYPPNRLFYYRGGMQNWQALGFNTAKP